MQLSMFDGEKQFKINKPIRLIELFAGIGSQAKALKNLGVEFEHYRICEFDKYAVASYNAVHGTNFETSDITKITSNDLGIVDTDKYCYIMTYSFPCVDLSNAGKGLGMAKGSGTRSGLLWEVERLLDECKELPNVLLMENVPQVIGQNNIEHFAKWIEKLEQLGYKNKWQVLNAKDYGIPQNRERCFMVSILGDYYYEFPKTIPLTLRLKDMLEKEVDEKYYLSDKQLVYAFDCNRVCDNTKRGDLGDRVVNPQIAKTISCRGAESQRADITNFVVGNNSIEYTLGEIRDVINLKRELCNNLVLNGMVEEGDIIRHSYTKSRMQGEMKDIKEKGLCPTLDTRCDCLGVTVKDEPKLLQVAQLTDKKYNEMTGRVYSDKGLCPTIRTMQGGGLEQKIAEPLALDEQNKYIRQDGCVGTLTTDGSSPKHNNRILETNYRIRKLTPKECWRLMGFEDKDINNAIAIGMSNAQLYKQAGNSICVPVLMAIFSQII